MLLHSREKILKLYQPKYLPMKKVLSASKQGERIFRDAFDHSPIGIAILSIEGKWVIINRKVCQMVGYSSEELLQMTFQEIVHPDDLDAYNVLLKQLMTRQAETCQMEIRYLHKDGHVIWVFAVVSLVRNTDESPMHFILQINDISMRKRAEDALHESNRLLDATQHIGHIGGWEWDIDMQKMTWTDETYRIHGMNPSDFHAGSPEHILSSLACYDSGDRSAIEKAFQRCISEGISYDLEFPLTRMDGRRIHIRTKADAVWEGTRIRKVVGIIHDITELKQALAANEEIARRLELANQASNDVIWDWDAIEDAQQWNKSGVAVFGWSEIVDHPVKCQWWIDRIHPDDRHRVSDSFYAVVTNPNLDSWQDEYRFMKCGGAYAEVRDRGYIIRNAEGKALRMVGAMADITERRKTEMELKASEKKLKELSTLLHLLADNMPDMLWAKDLNKEYIFANKAICENLLIAADTMEPLGKTDMFFANRERNKHPENPEWHTFGEICRDSDAITLEAMKPMQFDEYGNVKGKFLYLDVHKAPLFDNNGKLLGVVGSGRDVTHARQTEAQLRKLSQALEQSPSGIIITDLEGTIEYVNAGFTQMTGYTLHEAKKIKPGFLLSALQSEKTEREIWERLLKGQVWKGEFQSKKKNGQLLWESDTISPIFDHSGTATHYLVIKEDVTVKKQATAQLIKSKENAEESDRLKTAFLQNMSHEIRTPMNAIMGFSSLLPSNFNNKSNLEKFSKIIDQCCSDLLEIINDILDISKIESGQSTLNIEECDIPELFDELAVFFRDYQQRLKKEDVKLIMRPADDALSHVRTDKTKLKQVLINLVGNAFKFTSHGSIECGVSIDQNKLMFSVADTGIGIPADKFDFIFDRFTQLSPPGARQPGGTGLGLPIVKGLVGLLGGKVWLESDLNLGTTFYFTTDYVQSDLPDNSRTQFAISQHENISNKKILIVEDDVYNAQYLNEVLKDYFSELFTVSNGQEAIQFAGSHHVDIILMDVRLPDISGYDAAQMILANNPRARIIAQTAYAANEEKQKAIAAGCVDYISKPTKQEQLLSMIRKHLK